MKTSRILIAAATLAALGGAFTAASARDLSASADVARDTVKGHAYQNGGVSKEQVVDMDHHLKSYDLRMTFSEGGHKDYAADLKLRIVDAQGHKAFGLGHAGPLTDVSLPAGHYRVVATRRDGVQESSAVDLKPGEPVNLVLHWPKGEV